VAWQGGAASHASGRSGIGRRPGEKQGAYQSGLNRKAIEANDLGDLPRRYSRPILANG
jgi:hypothetical protein